MRTLTPIPHMNVTFEKRMGGGNWAEVHNTFFDKKVTFVALRCNNQKAFLEDIKSFLGHLDWSAKTDQTHYNVWDAFLKNAPSIQR